jgi:chloramphenicol-sensitive protein RarD
MAAYGAWGLAPLYFTAVAGLPPLEVLAHRVVWSVVLLGLLLVVRRQFRAAGSALRTRRILMTLIGTTLLIAINWFTFIYSVTHDLLVYASLGYFINPLLYVLLGFLLLGERLRRWQKVSVTLAAVGVGSMVVTQDRLPATGMVIAMTLALSFGFYGLLRKTVRVDALVGLAIETALLSPVAAVYLILLAARHEGSFGVVSWRMDGLLAFAGVVTALPLLWFTNAARRLRLATLGILQYLAPTGHFLLAVLTFGEPLTRTHLTGFAFIWSGLLMYSMDAAMLQRRVGDWGPRNGAGDRIEDG